MAATLARGAPYLGLVLPKNYPGGLAARCSARRAQKGRAKETQAAAVLP